MPSNVPEEILLFIFKNVNPKDLKECQKVCRSWYSPAHTKFLNHVQLPTVRTIEKFIDSIDSNTRPRYLHAVKEMSIFTKAYEPANYQISRDNIEKLFSRFPNLKNVHIVIESDFFAKFDTQLCEIILNSCPMLNNVNVFAGYRTDPSQYSNLVCKLSPLLTSVTLDGLRDVPDLGSLVTSFPRLKLFHDHCDRFDSFRLLLEILGKLANFTTLLAIPDHDDEDFAEHYLTMKSKQEQDLIIARLFNITTADLLWSNSFCENQIKFILNYMTGLKTFIMKAYDMQNITAAQSRVFCNDILDFVSSRDYGNAYLGQIPLNMMKRCTVSAIQKLFHQAPSTTRRILKLSPQKRIWPSEANLFDLEVKSRQSVSERTISITCSPTCCIQQVIKRLINDQVKDIDVLVLDLDRSSSTLNSDTYDSVLRGLPALKEIILDVPEAFMESTHNHHDQNIVHSGIESMTIRLTNSNMFQPLFEKYQSAFPNLKRLHLHYTSGRWDQGVGEFRMMLPEYTLEYLEIDLTPVKLKTIKFLMYQHPNFLILDVKVLHDSQQRLYSVPLDLQTSPRRINDDFVGNRICGRHYYRVHVTVKSLQTLVLRINDSNCKNEDDYLRDQVDSSILHSISTATIQLTS